MTVFQIWKISNSKYLKGPAKHYALHTAGSNPIIVPMAVASVQISTYYFSTWHLPYIIGLIAVEILYFLILNFYFIF